MSLTNETLQQLLHDHDRKQQVLLERCRNDDRQAFTQFVLKYQDTVFSYMLHKGQDHEDALKLTTAVFIEAFKHIATYQGERSPEVWLFTIAERQVQQVLRKRKTWRERFFPVRKPESPQKPETSLRERACQEIETLLLAYMDGELYESDILRVENHLAECVHCRQEYAQLQQTDSLLRLSSIKQAPSELRVQINAALDALQIAQQQPFWRKIADFCPLSGSQLAAIAASMAMIFSALVYYTQYQQLHTMRALLQQTQTRNGAAIDPSQAVPGGKFVILSGTITPESLSLQEARVAAGITSDPENTQIIFISGKREDLENAIEHRIHSMGWKIVTDQVYQEQQFTIRKITAEIPENSLTGFSQFLQQLKDVFESTGPPPELKTTLVEIYLVERQK
ncbi:RNA polymerase, sigma-24 subunit, ECF subfamily [Candidatus Vecturithrix granuli]|uniref:RNA polymerase, sigma-24 subunit, ECF subfamily n=1 Tax=Vecturithrix granuli TaxID=1499967 RepID=A0A081C6J0_VECG1|nr:RNA polymerase, sigma-24 subunit, ECF subfamily [Candidatus Vecturithrix granuli]